MLPAINSPLSAAVPFVEPSSYTWYLDIDNNIIFGRTDGQEAMKQAIYLALNTERFKWVIFSWNCGSELEELFGKPISWVVPEVKRRIEECLLNDSRIKKVDTFSFEESPHKLLVKFTAHTIYGDVNAQKEVKI